MNPDDLASLLRAQPFHPFRLCLTDGQGYPVRHPDAVRIAGRTAVVFTRSAEGPHAFVYDRFDLVSLLHVVRAEMLPDSATAATNGPTV